MHKLSLDYNRCYWHGVMRAMRVDVKGFAAILEIDRRQVFRWLAGGPPSHHRILQLVEILTKRHAGRRGLPGAYDILAEETRQTRANLRRWAQQGIPEQEGHRVLAMAVWQSQGYLVNSYRLVDFERRSVEVLGQFRKPGSRWVAEFGYLPPNPFELWPWPDPHGGVLEEPDRPSMARFRQEAAQSREVERRRLSGRSGG